MRAEEGEEGRDKENEKDHKEIIEVKRGWPQASPFCLCRVNVHSREVAHGKDNQKTAHRSFE
jgi:hypothetical protein